MSDDNVIIKQILSTHAPDGRQVDVRALLCLVEDMFNRAIQLFDSIVNGTRAEMKLVEKGQNAKNIAMLEALTHTIDRILNELVYKALGGSDAHSTKTSAIFNLLSSYAWEAKLVLSLLTFALNYGESWLIYSTKQLKLVKTAIPEQKATDLKPPRFVEVNDLIQKMMDVSRCVVEIKELPSEYITEKVPALATAITDIPTAAYWTIRSIVACATQITILTSKDHEYDTPVIESLELELSTLADKLKNIYEHLRTQLNCCYQFIEKTKEEKTFQMLLSLFDPNVMHFDNMEILRALIYAKDDRLPLLDGATKRKVGLDVLRWKNVLLLISSLEISSDELSILELIYDESRFHATRLESKYEIVWIPIVDRSIIPLPEETISKFENLRSCMPWYSVDDPLLIEKPKFIKEVCHFRAKPILVVLDPQGKVVSPNAIHMMWIWGSNAFPFTSLREEALWGEETWRLELLIDGIDPMILNWIKEDKYIFLYGGDDIEWARKFSEVARSVATASRISLEMVYVGKSTKREQVRKVIEKINAEKLSYAWQDQAMVWFFWTRLESMLFSKIQLGRADEHDPIMQQIKKLISYDINGGWAMLSKGCNIVVNGHSTTVFATLAEYEIWKYHVADKGFDLAFKEYHDKIHNVANLCNRLEFQSSTTAPESMKCPECNLIMKKYNTFLCCHE